MGYDNYIDNMSEKTPVTINQNRKTEKRIVGIIAFLAIVLTVLLWPQEKNRTNDVSGTLKVYTYDTASNTRIDTMTPVEFGDAVSSLGVWGPALSSVRGIPLKFQVEDRTLGGTNIQFHICVNGGRFIQELNTVPPETVELGQDFVIANGETVLWNISSRD